MTVTNGLKARGFVFRLAILEIVAILQVKTVSVI